MSDFITLACPSCSGQLKVTAEMDRFACRHCGREHLVRRSPGHAVELAPVVARLEKASQLMDRHVAELAIRRLRDDRSELKSQLDSRKRSMRNAEVDARLQWSRTFRSAVVAVALAFAAVAIRPIEQQVAAMAIVLCITAAIVGLVSMRSLLKARRYVTDSRARIEAINGRINACEDELKHHAEATR